jgi:hypothetical protein
MPRQERLDALIVEVTWLQDHSFYRERNDERKATTKARR